MIRRTEIEKMWPESAWHGGTEMAWQLLRLFTSEGKVLNPAYRQLC